jgi:drug/metabolite transporter (DMT)-like permease
LLVEAYFVRGSMGFIYVAITVLCITAVAYLAKLAARRNVPAFDFVFVMFAVAVVMGFFWTKLNHVGAYCYTDVLLRVSVWAGIGGAAAVFIFNMAVRIGHFGYSNAIYRSSFLIPVVVSVQSFGAKPDIITITGILLVLTSIITVSWSDNAFPAAGGKGNLKWFFMIVCAFLASGLPRTAQLIVSQERLNSSAYLLASYSVGFAMLLICLLLRRKHLCWLSLLHGSIAAIASFAGVYFTIAALKLLPAFVVFPVTLSTPIILGMLISLVYGEKIRPVGLAGIVVGICGIVMLSFHTYMK